ncbi:MAG: acyl-CoA synthetase, partial [Pseudomonadota bacterium]|nr:acyl-CoA synthetase [Pseudomonadota bacterium]
IHFETDKVGIGLPGPGVEMKLVPTGERYEARLRGPMLMQGYLDEPEKTAAAFDEEGYYRTGDLVVFHDRDDPAQGLAFAGRMAEEFKLSNGTWVYGGQMRDKLLKTLNEELAEIVLADDGAPFLGLLAWPKPGTSLDAIAAKLAEFNEGQRGGSAKIRRVTLLETPPTADANEISDKGTINRRAVLDNRKSQVDALFADEPPAHVRAI